MVLDKSLKQRIYVDAQDSYFVQCVSPIEDQIGRLTAIATIIAGLTPAIQGIPDAIANFFFAADNITELGLNRNSIAGNLTRAYACFINNSTGEITLILSNSSDGAINKGIILKPGGSYEINAPNLYQRKVSAIDNLKDKLKCQRRY